MVAVTTSEYWRGCSPTPPPPPHAPEEHYNVEPNVGYELALRTGNMYVLSFQIVYKCLSIIRMTKAMEMKENEAYGPVSSSQPPPPPASEGAYDL